MCAAVNRSFRLLSSVLSVSRLQLVQSRFKARDVVTTVQWKPAPRESRHSLSYSGDQLPFQCPDLKLPRAEFAAIAAEIARADAATADVLSLNFANSRELRRFTQQQSASHVQRHRFDDWSYEVQIARATVRLRHQMQAMMNPMHRHNKQLRNSFVTAVRRRSQQLQRLRQLDYRRFEWLIEQLGIVYRPPLPEGAREAPLRKSGIRRLVTELADKIRQDKLDALRAEFDAQKPEFEREKRAALEWIVREEEQLGLRSSVDQQTWQLRERRLPKRLVVPQRRHIDEYIGIPTVEDMRG